MSKALFLSFFSLLLFHLYTLRKLSNKTSSKLSSFQHIFLFQTFSQKQKKKNNQRYLIYLNKTLFLPMDKLPQVKLDFKNNKIKL